MVTPTCNLFRWPSWWYMLAPITWKAHLSPTTWGLACYPCVSPGWLIKLAHEIHFDICINNNKSRAFEAFKNISHNNLQNGETTHSIKRRLITTYLCLDFYLKPSKQKFAFQINKYKSNSISCQFGANVSYLKCDSFSNKPLKCLNKMEFDKEW